MKILIATGGSPHSDEAVRMGIAFARATRSSISILTVIKVPEERAKGQSIIDRAVALTQQLDSGPGPVDVKVRLGHPAEAIVNEASEGHCHLIVIGTWPKHRLLHRLLAPTTERVVMQAPCPVLVAKGEMEHLRNVLLCVSGARNPSQATRFLRETAAQMSEPMNITLLHVMSQISANPAIRNGWQLEATAEKLMGEDTPEGEWLRKEIETLKNTGVNPQPKVRHGFVVDEVLMEALEGDYDLLVIGAHRQVGWQRFLLDDLTNQIIVRADRSVLVV